MRITSKLIAAAALALVPGALAAQGGDQEAPRGGVTINPRPTNPPTRQGTRGANFLENGIGARGSAMAGAIGSLVEGPTALYWNPAGAAATEALSVAASRHELYTDLDIAQNFIGITVPALGGVLGASFNSLNSGEMDRTSEDAPLGSPITGRSFEWNSISLGLSYARRLTDRLDVGVTGKYISEGITDARISWAAVDVGTQFRTGIHGFTIGGSIANLGPSSSANGALIKKNVLPDSNSVVNQFTRLRYTTIETDLPTMFRFSIGSDVLGRAESLFGARYGTAHSLVADLTFSDAIDTDIQFAGGIEYGFRNLVFVRGGKRFFNDDRNTGSESKFGLSGGLGVRLPFASRNLRFDYAYTSLGELENVQVFSFELGR
jgi:hypothetical protein